MWRHPGQSQDTIVREEQRAVQPRIEEVPGQERTVENLLDEVGRLWKGVNLSLEQNHNWNGGTEEYVGATTPPVESGLPQQNAVWVSTFGDSIQCQGSTEDQNGSHAEHTAGQQLLIINILSNCSVPKSVQFDHDGIPHSVQMGNATLQVGNDGSWTADYCSLFGIQLYLIQLDLTWRNFVVYEHEEILFRHLQQFLEAYALFFVGRNATGRYKLITIYTEFVRFFRNVVFCVATTWGVRAYLKHDSALPRSFPRLGLSEFQSVQWILRFLRRLLSGI